MLRGRAFTIVNSVVAVMFLVSAALQYNDDDPAGWIAMYLAAGLACLLHRRTSLPWLVPALVGASAALWAISLAPATLPDLRLADLGRSMKAESPQIELGREMLGLAIVAAWMAVLVLLSRARAPRSSKPAGSVS